jgi:hypothetical protein
VEEAEWLLEVLANLQADVGDVLGELDPLEVEEALERPLERDQRSGKLNARLVPGPHGHCRMLVERQGHPLRTTTDLVSV